MSRKQEEEENKGKLRYQDRWRLPPNRSCTEATEDRGDRCDPCTAWCRTDRYRLRRWRNPGSGAGDGTEGRKCGYWERLYQRSSGRTVGCRWTADPDQCGEGFCEFSTSRTKEELGEILFAQAKEYMAEGQFEANTMLPKIQASVEFVEQGEGKKAVITSIDKAVDAYLGRTGTVIC